MKRIIVLCVLMVLIASWTAPKELAFDFPTKENDMSKAINFGVLPHVYSDDTEQISVSVWGHLTSSGYLVSFSTNAGGVRFSITSVGAGTPYLRIYSNVFDSAPGNWNTDVFDSVLNGWHLFAHTYDISSPSNDPIFYIDGVVVNATETLTPAGAAYSRGAVPLIIGNRFSSTEFYDDPIGGKLFDARVYNRILTQAEITTLYNSGVPDVSLVTDGLVFQACCVRTNKLSDYVDKNLSGLKLIDNIRGVVGTVIGDVYGRTAP